MIVSAAAAAVPKMHRVTVAKFMGVGIGVDDVDILYVRPLLACYTLETVVVKAHVKKKTTWVLWSHLSERRALSDLGGRQQGALYVPTSRSLW